MKETDRRPTRRAPRKEQRDLAGRGVGFEAIGKVAERVLAELRAKIVANDNAPTRED